MDEAPIAAVDLGSNSFRLEIGRVRAGQYRRLAYFKRVVRLGAGLDADRRLVDPVARAALDCLREFATELADMPATRVRAVATQTLREAANRDDFLAQGRQALGHDIEVISGREEARLIFCGVSHLQPSSEPRLVVDIGGRSTELVLGQRTTPTEAESFPVGSVGLSLRYFGDGALTASAFRAAQVAAGAEFEEALASFAPSRWREALGSSGTIGAVADILRASGISDGTITPGGLQWLIDRCIAAGHIDRLTLQGLREDRRAVLPGGLAVLYTVLMHFRIEHLLPAKGALRQGVIIDLHERLKGGANASRRDVRHATIRTLQQRFGVDVTQAQAVRERALALFDSLAAEHGPKPDTQARQNLAWACELHEIGMSVSHHDHHRHSAYLVAHLDAPGFSQSQQRQLAALVLAQRGGLRKVEAQLQDDTTRWQVLCLRLAVILCHARGEPAAQGLVLSRLGPSQLRLGWSPKRPAPNPRTQFLLREEAQAWTRVEAWRLEWAL